MSQNFNSGQEIIYQDLNTLSSRIQKEFYDRVLFRILQNKTDAFFADDFKVIFTGATAVKVNLGLGFQQDLSVASSEPTMRPVYQDADTNLAFETPDNSNPRIDLIVVASIKVDSETASRKFKDEFSGTISNQNFVVAVDWGADLLVVKGTAAGSPVAPVVPVGFIKLAECLISASVGMADQGNITDSRTILPQASATGGTGTQEYDIIVGDLNVIGTTHSTLAAALAAALDGSRILVTRDEDVDAIPTVITDNIEIIFKKGVTLTKDGVIAGLQISADYCTVKNGRFSGFSVGGDSGIIIDAATKGVVIDACRFLSCDTNIIDDGDSTYINVEYTE